MVIPPVGMIEIINRARACTTLEEADALIGEIGAGAPNLLDKGDARRIVLANIGYFTGYLSDRTEAARILDLFKTEHPLFGRSNPSFSEALQAGIDFAKERQAHPEAGIGEAMATVRKRFEP